MQSVLVSSLWRWITDVIIYVIDCLLCNAGYCNIKVVLRLRITYLGHLRAIAPTGMIN